MMKTIINSKKIEVKKHGEDIINFLSDLRNYAPIMPSGVSKFVATDALNCSYMFGITKIDMRRSCIGSVNAGGMFVTLVSKNFSNMELNITIESKENSSLVQIIFSADLTPMQKVLMSGQMQKFVEEILSKLKKVIE